MRILVLGGTVFLGRHFVEAATRVGHEVTVFHRGRHGAELFPGIERIVGDRDGDLDLLAGREWDAVLDTSGYVPRVVGASVRKLAACARFYAFVSSVSVYADLSQPGVDEHGCLATIEDCSTEEITGETYGALKALCEREVISGFGNQCLVIRPGLIVGPYDPSDRFTYWPVRLASQREVLAPGSPGRPVQIIDARDLAEWVLLMCESRRPGTFNAVGPSAPLTFGELVATCREVGGCGATVTWVPERFLLDAGIQPWSDLPVWLPEADEYAGVDAVDGRRAWQDGLRTRPLRQTVADTLEWHATRPEGSAMRAGLSREREAELLEHWRSAQAGQAT